MTTYLSTAAEADLTADEVERLGPIDFIAIEFPHRHSPGEGLPILVDLVDRGVIRILDIVFLRKEADSTVNRLKLADLSPELAVFEGASSGLLDDEDVKNAGDVIEADSAACLVIFENRWLGPLAVALRRGGAQLVASERLHVQALLARLDALDALDATTAKV